MTWEIDGYIDDLLDEERYMEQLEKDYPITEVKWEDWFPKTGEFWRALNDDRDKNSPRRRSPPFWTYKGIRAARLHIPENEWIEILRVETDSFRDGYGPQREVFKLDFKFREEVWTSMGMDIHLFKTCFTKQTMG